MLSFCQKSANQATEMIRFPAQWMMIAVMIAWLSHGWIIAGESIELSRDPLLVPALRDVRWTGGFWKARQDTCFYRSLPAMSVLMHDTVRSQFLHNFRIAAGEVPGTHRGPDWNDGDTYKWLEALCAAWALTGDMRLRGQLDHAVTLIKTAQRKDGYLHTPVLIANRNGDTAAAPFGNPVNFEMYNFGHLMTAATVHHEATGNRELLEVAERAADFLDREFAKPDANRARHAICPAHYMGIIDLYRVTRESRYLALAKRWLAMRDLVTAGGDDNQDRVPFREQREIVGHAVRANYLMAGVADLLLETRDTSLWPTLEACWNSLVSRKLYITGGCGALYDGASPDGSSQQKVITRIHQAYGRNYQLPNSTAHNESCAAVGSVLWNHRMLRITGEAKYADLLETTLLNAVLATVSLDGQKYFYTNTLRQLETMPTELRWSRSRQNWISCYCCPPNIVRLLAQVGRYAYLVDEARTTVVLYGANQLDTSLADGAQIKIRQVSNYPWEGAIRCDLLQVPNRDYGLRFRIPGWCSSAQLKINGEPSNAQMLAGSFIEVRRQWRAGDSIELQLDMPVRLIEAHPLVEECRGQVAVRRGPLIYCLESRDLPADCSLLDVAVDANAEWKLENSESLADIRVLRGNLRRIDSSRDPKIDWNVTGGLYRELGQIESKSREVVLIPYFAWGNRGDSEMSVWLPLSR